MKTFKYMLVGLVFGNGLINCYLGFSQDNNWQTFAGVWQIIAACSWMFDPVAVDLSTNKEEAK